MTKVYSTFRGAFCALALFICLTAYAASAQAQQTQRSFVASTGNDANNCSRPTPCRNFARAIDTTFTGGEVVVIDSAGYGAATINKSITISAPAGVQASITAATGAGITVTGGGAVILRGLSLIGLGTASLGINYSGTGSLSVDNCILTGFTEEGINSSGTTLFVKSTIIRNGGLDGILVNGGSATIDNCRIERNGPNAPLSGGYGIYAKGNSRVMVRNTVAASNGIGFVAEDSAVLNAENCVATKNTAVGFRVGGGTVGGASTMRVSNSVATSNDIGFQQFATPTGSGTFESRENNTVRGNPIDAVGAITGLGGT